MFRNLNRRILNKQRYIDLVQISFLTEDVFAYQYCVQEGYHVHADVKESYNACNKQIEAGLLRHEHQQCMFQIAQCFHVYCNSHDV